MSVPSDRLTFDVDAYVDSGPPRHLGIIIDGNRRWARAQGLPTLEGHRHGYELIRDIGHEALSRGVQVVSAYLLSTENLSRDPDEVAYLLDLLEEVATHHVAHLHAHDIAVRFMGSRAGLPDRLVDAMDRAEYHTAGNQGGVLALCVNYGGHTEIADAVERLLAAGTLPGEITPQALGEHLYAPDLPPLDLVIRTGGERRLSNFMLWRAAYAEFCFVSKMWPAFTPTDLDAALADYAGRTRRFGR